LQPFAYINGIIIKPGSRRINQRNDPVEITRSAFPDAPAAALEFQDLLAVCAAVSFEHWCCFYLGAEHAGSHFFSTVGYDLIHMSECKLICEFKNSIFFLFGSFSEY
jgi:hypothetical protein